MFATFTDWTSDEPKAFAESAHELWPSMKEAGAVNMRVVQTSDKGVRNGAPDKVPAGRADFIASI